MKRDPRPERRQFGLPQGPSQGASWSLRGTFSWPLEPSYSRVCGLVSPLWSLLASGAVWAAGKRPRRPRRARTGSTMTWARGGIREGVWALAPWPLVPQH
eukprot:8471540-Pyramimonas_sp.AAC.1